MQCSMSVVSAMEYGLVILLANSRQRYILAVFVSICYSQADEVGKIELMCRAEMYAAYVSSRFGVYAATCFNM